MPDPYGFGGSGAAVASSGPGWPAPARSWSGCSVTSSAVVRRERPDPSAEIEDQEDQTQSKDAVKHRQPTRVAARSVHGIARHRLQIGGRVPVGVFLQVRQDLVRVLSET